MYPCAPQMQGYLQGLGWMCVSVRVVGAWMCATNVQGRKQEAGSKLGCSITPKWTISHKPRGLVLMDPGRTGVGFW